MRYYLFLLLFLFIPFTVGATTTTICGVGFTTGWTSLNNTWTSTNGSLYVDASVVWSAFLASDTGHYMIEQNGSYPDTEGGGYFVDSTNNILTGVWSGTGGRSNNSPLFVSGSCGGGSSSTATSTYSYLDSRGGVMLFWFWAEEGVLMMFMLILGLCVYHFVRFFAGIIRPRV